MSTFWDEFTKEGAGVKRAASEIVDALKKPAREAAKRPSKYWRNRWRKRLGATPGGQFVTFEGVRFPPQADGTSLAPNLWPSREIAEEMALRVIRTSRKPAIYLGAVPCDEHGNPI